MNNRFISENQIEEAKKKRAEEWEAARKAGRELPKEEEEIKDTRSLYERLKEQKDKKQEAFEEQLKFKNMIYKGLNEEDASFLSMVARKQAEIDNQRYDDSSKEMQDFKAAQEERTFSNITEVTTSKQKISDDFIKKKSQADIMSGLVVRKRKSSSSDQGPSSKKTDEKNQLLIKETREKSGSLKNNTENSSEKITGSSLTSLAAYSSSSEDETDDKG